MPDPTRFRGTLTVKKPSSPGPVAAALTNARPSLAKSPVDQATRMPLSVAALLAGGRGSPLGYFFGSPTAPAETAINVNADLEENSDVVRSK